MRRRSQWKSIDEYRPWLRYEATDAEVIAHTKRSVQQHPVWRAEAEAEWARRQREAADMARRRSPELQKGPAELSPAQMQSGIKKLRRRLEELEQALPIEQWNDDHRVKLDGLWRKTDDALVQIFGNDTTDYDRYKIGKFLVFVARWGNRDSSPGEYVEGYTRALRETVGRIGSAIEVLEERLEEVEGDAGDQPHVVAAAEPQAGGRRVFVVHGRDNAAKEAVARFLMRVDLEPIILHEQADRGRTIIEKFEQHTDVAFAVVVMTPDDVGALSSDVDKGGLMALEKRARQNVVLELGYFLGRLGRNRVCALMKDDVTVPSDYLNVLYTPMDEHGAWRTKLAGEIYAAGIEIDFKKAAAG